MGIIIKEMKILDDSYSFISNDGEEGNILKNLSKINIFVGENNSGKSRFLRSIFFRKENSTIPEFIPNNNDFKIVMEAVPNLKERINEFADKYGFKLTDISSGTSDLSVILYGIEEFDFIKPNVDYIAPIIELKIYLKSLIENKERTAIQNLRNSTTKVYVYAIGEKLLEIFNECFVKLNKEIEEIYLNYKFTKIYIPILRGLRYISGGHNDVYFERTSIDYFQNLNEPSLRNQSIEIFTGLKSYQIVKEHLLGDLNQRKLIREFEKYLSKQFFNNEPIALIPKEGNDQILTIKIGNEHEMPIYNLGDGIQSIITITLPLFLREDEIQENENILVFIEEPEHMLHPSLQRKLVDTFLDKRFDKYQFFFTTHSNHFLDVALDFEGISIFTSNKKLDGDTEEVIPKFIIENVSFGDNNLLNMLGVRNSSVFLANCNIWVEGISDVLYFRRYLDIYQDYMKSRNPNFKKFREDHHYSFYKYDGSDISNLLSLNLVDDDKGLERLFLIRDRDDSKDKNKRNKDDGLKNLLGDNFYLLGCREVENLLTKDILLKTIENDKKYRNISLNKNFEYENYKNIKLNPFIKEKICYSRIDWNPIGSKRPFYNNAEKHILEWNDLSEEAKKITKKIYNFVRVNNS